MSLSTYAGLRDAIGSMLGRTDLTSAADVTADFVTLAEAQINRRLRLRQMIGRTTSTISSEYSTVPTDFAGQRMMRITSVTPIGSLEWVGPETMADLKAGWDQISGQPSKYSVVGSEFEFSPVPDGSYTLGITYYKAVPALSAGVNWLLTAWPDIYLYGACLQAAIYLQDAEAEAKFGRLFLTAISDAMAADITESTGGRLNVGSPYAP